MVKDAILDSIVAQSANNMVSWWVMSSYLYYHCDTSVLSDGRYDALCNQLHSEWDAVDHRHKYVIDRDALVAGTGFDLPVVAYPPLPCNAARVLAELPGLCEHTWADHTKWWRLERGVIVAGAPAPKKTVMFFGRKKETE